ncbi:MAG: DotI/IcmL family type IV secretion protein [Legionella sp.]|nr:DotI/IcmL family type IV secretion protein [Legionella sp.]
MKNTILWSALFAVIGTQVQADPTPAPAQTPTAPIVAPAPAPAPANAMKPAATQTQAAPAATAAPVVAPAPAPAAPVIDCDYKIPAQTKTIDQTLVLNWSEKAITQAFTFNAEFVDAQMQKLQACFTEQGWTGFNTALQKSGNLAAIKSQKLNVSSKIDGQALITESQNNQWKIILPVVVTYQNDKEKVSQLLSVDLTVGRKMTGDLGITQMIATPRGTVTTPQPPAIPNPATTDITKNLGDVHEGGAPTQAPVPAAAPQAPVAKPQ